MSAPPGADGTFERLVRGAFGRYLLPAIVLQSLLIGGGYATGREIVAYGAKFGALGWAPILVIFVGFTLVAALTFEVARVFRTYDYRSFIGRLIGPLWPLFDVLYVAMATLVIAVMASAASEIMRETLGVPPLAGTLSIVAAVGALSYHGSRVIEAFKSFGTAFLYLAYLLFAALVLSRRWGEAVSVFEVGDTSYLDGAALPAALLTGVLYVGYNLISFPAALFTLHRQTRRRETLLAAVVSGLLMTVPFALTYLCLMSFYPDPEVLDAPVPWLPMLGAVGGGAVVAFYGLVMGWTLLETSVGLIHAMLDRLDRGLRESDLTEGRRGLSRTGRGLLGAGTLAAAALLSRVGIITLVAEGYTLMAYFLIALFALPLLTVGTYRVLGARGLAAPRRRRSQRKTK